MVKRVLILGGQGRIGSSVAADLLAHTDVDITITGTSENPRSSATLDAPCKHYQSLRLEDRDGVQRAIAAVDLVVHCAGPFEYRDTAVLQACIDQGVNYIDVNDNRSYTRKILALHAQAQAAGITAIANSGVFPGMSNSMVRQAVEQLDTPEEIHIQYGVAGSGGAGVTVMRTTFLGLQHPFEVWIDGQWQSVKPYSEREGVTFPKPIGKTGVYWFDVPEAWTLATSFPVKTVTTKFGSTPDLYNSLTALVARVTPSMLMQQRQFIEFFSYLSYGMTRVSDRWSGVGIAMQVQVNGIKDGRSACYTSSVVHDHTATAAGCATGSLAAYVLAGTIDQPGVWPVERVLSTSLFDQAMRSRGIEIQRGWVELA
ncbi:MAG: saccharopine dehydrogenase NADP-binding domain-containing protein [Synechococcales cyanobacterium T60_A2020_003]|nr:saccharopine dehydrogenase NADP-binding domain-containing protein [Synechococcales cyanobacterium T60_A2020_003]